MTDDELKSNVERENFLNPFKNVVSQTSRPRIFPKMPFRRVTRTTHIPPLINPKLSGMKELQEKVKKAKRERKIFMLTLQYEAIRQGLLARNWLEKISDVQFGFGIPGSERLKIALLLKNAPFNFIWQTRLRAIKPISNTKPLVNSIWRQRQFDFTTKDGITSLANAFHWNYIEGVTDLEYQRTHVLGDKYGKQEFFEDFHDTFFTSFILFLNDHEDFRLLFSETGRISVECINYALQKIELLFKVFDHEDIDDSQIFDAPKNQDLMIENIKEIINAKKKFHFESSSILKNYKEQVQIMSAKILKKWPHKRYDGHKNLWVLKPLGASSGNGVIVLNNEDKIKAHILATKRTTFVAQKYIERPLLIHDRKFDIRIYFLTFIRDKHVNIWLYKDCYIKFATHPFSCDSFNKSIHITNYAVQKFFMNENNMVAGARENMWTLSQLIDYFGKIDKPRLWEAKIYPAIKKNLLTMILPSLEGTELEENNFELNGADFMVGFDYEPILIEVNSMPALFFSKVVMEMITTKLLDDVLKVVVDRTQDPNAYVGDFELIHSQEIYDYINGAELIVRGRAIERKIEKANLKRVEDKIAEFSPLNEKRVEYVANDGTKFIYIKEKA